MALQNTSPRAPCTRAAAKSTLNDGDRVILIDAKGRSYFKQLRAGHRMTIRGTIFRADEIIGSAEGCVAGDGPAADFRVFRPTIAELVPDLPRTAEPVFAKDLGQILVHTDIRAGLSALEIGVGNGMLTIALLGALGEQGRLSSYEIREDFAASARSNVERHAGSSANWTITVRDAALGLDESDFDRAVIDLPDPVRCLDSIAGALRPGGLVGFFLPTVMQVASLHEGLEKHPSFLYAVTREVLERSWHVEDGSIRPDQRMIGHTGFVTTVRRSAD